MSATDADLRAALTKAHEFVCSVDTGSAWWDIRRRALADELESLEAALTARPEAAPMGQNEQAWEDLRADGGLPEAPRPSEAGAALPFVPFAVFDAALDCVRVQWRDCSVVEERISPRLTLMFDNYGDEACVGFIVKGVAHACHPKPFTMPDIAARPALPATGTALDVELTDSMIMQMLGEAHAAERRAGEDALTIGCTPQQVHDIELAARCETIRSYLYQAGILNAERAATGTAPLNDLIDIAGEIEELTSEGGPVGFAILGTRIRDAAAKLRAATGIGAWQPACATCRHWLPDSRQADVRAQCNMGVSGSTAEKASHHPYPFTRRDFGCTLHEPLALSTERG